MNETECVDVKIIYQYGVTFIVFIFSGGGEYDPLIDDAKNKWWIHHMREKTWFNERVEEMLIEALIEYIK